MTRNVVPLYAAPPADGVDELAALRAELEEAERKLAEAERNALERAAKVCEERAEQHSFDMNTSWQAEECAEFIRALMKEGGAQAWSGEVSFWESEK
jgi:hypothetical protein